jgi:hypothetical protein
VDATDEEESGLRRPRGLRAENGVDAIRAAHFFSGPRREAIGPEQRGAE